MAASNPPGSVSSSGITVDAVTGERYIPSSVRADGSTRREIRVRPGYRPPEDVELYKNRAAEAWKNRGRGGIPGAEGLKESEPTTRGGSGSAASNKNAKRREAKKKAKAAQDEVTPSGGKDVTQIENWRSSKTDKKQTGGPEITSSTGTENTSDPAAEKEKKARNLKKKLRQARELNDKKNQGEALLPEQLEKVIKIQELIRQLDALGFDSNGDKKEDQGEEKAEK